MTQNIRIKILLSIGIALLLSALLAGCAEKAVSPLCGNAECECIQLDEALSYFDSYTIEDDVVSIKCALRLNNSGEACRVRIKGFFPNDVGKLLTDSPLDGYPVDSHAEDCVFNIQRGTSTVFVVFRGSYAGSPQKADRLLPEIVIEAA